MEISPLPHGVPLPVVIQKVKHRREIAPGFSNGTSIPRLSASSSFACQYGVEMIALPAPSAMASVPETLAPPAGKA